MKPSLVLSLAVAPLAAAEPAAALSDVFVFGDSLSDTGNVCSAADLLVPGVGYDPDRCSNGDVWTDVFANALGFPAAAVPSSSGGNNFAEGGDLTAGLADQVTAFSTAVGGVADPDALYVIWLGGNDVLDLPTDPNAMEDAVQNIVNGIGTLMGLGAELFLVPNLPNVGRVWGVGPTFGLGADPNDFFSEAEHLLAEQLSLEFNMLLAQELAAIAGATIFEVDVFGMGEEVIADPAAFGVSPDAIDTTSQSIAFFIPCLVDAACAAEEAAAPPEDPPGPIANGFLLFDAIHPTAAAHEDIALEALMALPEPSGATSLAAGLAAVLALAARHRRAGRGK